MVAWLPDKVLKLVIVWLKIAIVVNAAGNIHVGITNILTKFVSARDNNSRCKISPF